MRWVVLVGFYRWVHPKNPPGFLFFWVRTRVSEPCQKLESVGYISVTDCMCSSADFKTVLSMSIGAQSTLGTRHFCRNICVRKINKMPKFYMIFAQKIFSLLFWRGQMRPHCPISFARGFVWKLGHANPWHADPKTDFNAKLLLGRPEQPFRTGLCFHKQMFSFFFATLSPRSIDRSSWNFATWSETIWAL